MVIINRDIVSQLTFLGEDLQGGFSMASFILRFVQILNGLALVYAFVSKLIGSYNFPFSLYVTLWITLCILLSANAIVSQLERLEEIFRSTIKSDD